MTLEEKIGYRFSDKKLLEEALTHASTQKASANNERLEFLGDRVLGLIIADLLFKTFPQEREGDLAKRHTGLVQQKTLAIAAQKIELSAYLKLSDAEARAGGSMKETILSDALEALIGAVYRDGGYAAAQTLVTHLFEPHLHEYIVPPEDAKTALQEWAQARSLPLPHYEVVSRSGSDHAPVFEVEVSVKGHGTARAKDSSKRAAEKEAAAALLKEIGA